MNSSRERHGVILAVDRSVLRFMVIGGLGTKNNEACLFDDGELNCTELSSNLTDFSDTPILFLVDNDYKNC